MSVVVRGGLNVFLADEAARSAEFEGVVDDWEVIYRGSEVDAGFRNGPEIDEVFKYGTGTCWARRHGMVAKAEWRFSMAEEGRKSVLLIVRWHERMADPGVFGWGARMGVTKAGSRPCRRAIVIANSKYEMESEAAR